MQNTNSKDKHNETPCAHDSSPRFRQVTGLADKVTAAQYMRKLRLLTTVEPTLTSTMWPPPRLRGAMLQAQEVGDQVLILDRVPATGRDEFPWDLAGVVLFTVPPRAPADPTGSVRVTFLYLTDDALGEELTGWIEDTLIETCRRLGRTMITGQIQRYLPPDKYAVDNCNPDCLQCGACCMGFYRVHLTEQDVADGIEYDVRRPYLLRQRPDGTCWYYDSDRRLCEIYEKRPIVCRQFTCSGPQAQGRGGPRA